MDGWMDGFTDVSFILFGLLWPFDLPTLPSFISGSVYLMKSLPIALSNLFQVSSSVTSQTVRCLRLLCLPCHLFSQQFNLVDLYLRSPR